MYTAIMTNVQNIIIYVKNCLINRSSSPLWRRGVYMFLAVYVHLHTCIVFGWCWGRGKGGVWANKYNNIMMYSYISLPMAINSTRLCEKLPQTFGGLCEN